MFDIEALDPASRSLAHELLRHHPELKGHARIEQRPGRDEAYLILTIPAAVEGEPAMVVDSGDPERVLVQWGRWSQEFTAPRGGGRSSELAEAISLVEDLLADTVTIWTLEVDGRWRGAGVLYDEFDERRLLSGLKPGSRLELRTWSGGRIDVIER
ncbi:hypothetical protein [Engelhardtia mirabilis]|uniref:Uncharacterized protein n=1 Tax=Engelhardtia mirabilis TaxID=2528011 RepID=A0A518BQT8_9BACT|nr:hypothetical protein Pla133_44580 [Planctomycetes bacterium Pla133]QDV03665.1 hypothetical protein Pla86_44560 [Planctomycetes bacterium Pla86]